MFWSPASTIVWAIVSKIIARNDAPFCQRSQDIWIGPLPERQEVLQCQYEGFLRWTKRRRPSSLIDTMGKWQKIPLETCVWVSHGWTHNRSQKRIKNGERLNFRGQKRNNKTLLRSNDTMSKVWNRHEKQIFALGFHWKFIESDEQTN